MNVPYISVLEDKRSIRIYKNVIASSVLKVLDGIVALLLVPITLNYLNPDEYGIWLTMNSILIWINSFDIGLGNGLRNQLTKAIADNDKELAKVYVSTTFFMLIGLVILIIFVYSLCEPKLNWYFILDTTPQDIPNLSNIVYVTFIICCFNFILKIINTIYLAFQMPAISNLITVSGHFVSLIIIFFLTKYTTGNLLFVALAYSLSPLVVYLIAYPITFVKLYQYLLPSLYYVKLKYAKGLMGVGAQFFLIQISGILLFSTINLLIMHLFGHDKVSMYNIAYRYFSVILMLMNIILTPMWSATTSAFHKGDIQWIKKSMSNIRKCLYISYIILFLMVIASPIVFRLWIGSIISIPLPMTILMAIYIAIVLTSTSYSVFLNGIGKLRIQTFNTVSCAIFSVPLCWILGLYFDISGVLVGMCLLNISGLILNIIQFNKVMTFNAQGIWNR